MLMLMRKKVFVIVGSPRTNSSNRKVIEEIRALTNSIELYCFEGLTDLPHFNPDHDIHPPQIVIDFRQKILNADGVIICTPEYVFSLPAILKNAFEWCVSTTVFAQKKTGLITASASGEKANEELQLVMKTLEAKVKQETTILIRGVKGKFDSNGVLTDKETIVRLRSFVAAFEKLLNEK
jgi:chromate reductase, NAD(P)H dehydrogenase (quinone)